METSTQHIRSPNWRNSLITGVSTAPPAPNVFPATMGTSSCLNSGVAIVAGRKCLRISWRDLHQHCVAQDITSTAEAPPAAQGFVELPIAPLSWSLPPLSAAVELHRADGARMRIQTHSSQLPLERLVKTFLETP